MNVLNSIFKLLCGFAIGIIAGLLIAAVGIVCFTDTTFAEFLGKLQSARFADAMLAATTAVLIFIISSYFLILLHEAGHLIAGLLSGYKFVSFRILSYTFIKEDGHLRVKRFSIAGTAGQCLLVPPELPLERIPTGWYNFGGVFANILAVLAILPTFWLSTSSFVIESATVFCLTGVFLIILNGVPMKIAGSNNDGYNMLNLRKNLTGKRGFADALRINALLQNGVRLKDMPPEWFEIPAEINYKDPFEVSIPLTAASRLIDKLDFDASRALFEIIYEEKEELIAIYSQEIACELIFLRLVTGNTEGAAELLTERTKKYIETYRRTMSSKERVMCAIYLYKDKDREKATSVYDSLLARKDRYLMQGEVLSDLAIMRTILERD